MGACQCATKKKMIFSYFRVEICSVCLVVRAGVERIDRVGSDGCTSVGQVVVLDVSEHSGNTGPKVGPGTTKTIT